MYAEEGSRGTELDSSERNDPDVGAKGMGAKARMELDLLENVQTTKAVF